MAIVWKVTEFQSVEERMLGCFLWTSCESHTQMKQFEIVLDSI